MAERDQSGRTTAGGEPSQSDPLPPVVYELQFGDGPNAEWSIYRLRVEEALNRSYSATLDAMTETEGVDTELLLGADATLTIGRAGGELQYLYGVVSRVDYLGFAEHRLCVRFHLLPGFELLRQRVDSRIWQELSVQDIVSEVLEQPLGELERSFDFGEVRRGASPRDYCVQYNESDLDYVTRLLEEEGISYLFVHQAGKGHEALALRDANTQYPALENSEGPVEIPIITNNFEEFDTESLQTFEWSRELTSTASMSRDFDWNTPTKLLTTPAKGDDERGRIRRRYVHGHRRYIEDDLAQQSSDLQKAVALGGGVARGRSNATILRPGFKFKIADHERDDLLNVEYIITEVVHAGDCSDIAAFADLDGQRYTNEFQCVPISAEIRPTRRTPKPLVHGPQTALVTGDGGDEIHTDKHGRVQVQFHWEEQPSYARGSSCWVRCAQTWAGLSFGAQFIPRVGMEVVVEFLEGNPDRPLVIGCVYNGDNPPPFPLPDKKTQSGWRTNSSPKGSGSNELRFEDATGNEEIYIHGQKDWKVEIENDKSQTIGNDETRSVGHDEGSKIGNDQMLSVGKDQSTSVGKDQSLTVGSMQQIQIGADRTEMIGANHTQTIASNNTVTVGQMYGLAIGAGYNVVVGAGMTLGVGGSMATTVGGASMETVVGSKTVSADDITVQAKKKYALESGKDMSFTSGKKLAVKAADSVGIKGDKNGTIEFAKKMVLKCGDASITLKKNGDIVLKGKNVSITGSGDVKLKGSNVGNN